MLPPRADVPSEDVTPALDDGAMPDEDVLSVFDDGPAHDEDVIAALDDGATGDRVDEEVADVAPPDIPWTGHFECTRQPFIVRSAEDSTGAPTLREALTQAATCASRVSIIFSSSLAGSAIAVSTAGDSAAGPSAFVILPGMDVSIDGGGMVIARAEGASDLRLAYIRRGGTLRLRNLGVQRFSARGGNGGMLSGGGGAAGMGGVFFNEGTLSLDGCEFGNNSASGGAGTIPSRWGCETTFGGNGGGGGGLSGSGSPGGSCYLPGAMGGPPNGGGGGASTAPPYPGGGSSGTVGGFGGGGGGGGAGSQGGGNGGRGGFGGGGGGGGPSHDEWYYGGLAGPGGFGGGAGSGGCGFNPSYAGNIGSGGFGGGTGGSGCGGPRPNMGGGGGAGMGGVVFNHGGALTIQRCAFQSTNVARGGTCGAVSGCDVGNGQSLGTSVFSMNAATSENGFDATATVQIANTFPGCSESSVNIFYCYTQTACPCAAE
ncbi:MAG: hypothetical protein U0326_20375 [Polyangiales bacterium]